MERNCNELELVSIPSHFRSQVHVKPIKRTPICDSGDICLMCDLAQLLRTPPWTNMYISILFPSSLFFQLYHPPQTTMIVIEFSGGVMAVKESGGPAAFPDLSVLGGIPMMGGGMIKKEEEDHVDECYSNARWLIKSKLEKIKVVKGEGEGNGYRCPARQLQGPVHYQVLKIKEEDSHLGEDIGEGLTSKDKLAFVRQATSQILWPRSILPCSPLGAKKATIH